jgi:hypothetical protein
MSRPNHYRQRAFQRASISNQSNSQAFAKNAFRYGHFPDYYEQKYLATNNELYDKFYHFLLNKELSGKRVKVYKQWIFIFNSTNNNPTTIYPIPDRYLDLAEIVTIDTQITYKLFNNPTPYIVKTTKSQTTLKHIKKYFAEIADQYFPNGPFFLTKDGTIEKDFSVVGLWRIERIS